MIKCADRMQGDQSKFPGMSVVSVSCGWAHTIVLMNNHSVNGCGLGEYVFCNFRLLFSHFPSGMDSFVRVCCTVCLVLYPLLLGNYVKKLLLLLPHVNTVIEQNDSLFGCWKNNFSQLGILTLVDSSVPLKPFPPLLSIRELIASGDDMAIALMRFWIRL